MRKTLRNIIAGSLIAGSLLLTGCPKVNNIKIEPAKKQLREIVGKETYDEALNKAIDKITGEQGSYDKALKFAQNPIPVTDNAVKEVSKQKEIKVYMEKNEEDNFDIYADINSEKRRLTDDPAIDAFPLLSPDKKKVLFNSDRNNELAAYVINIDGTNLKKIINLRGLDSIGKWSEDEKKIIYKVWTSEELTAEGGELKIGRRSFNTLYTVNIETGEMDIDNSELNQIIKEETESHMNQ